MKRHPRRTFLKVAGAAAISAGFPACATKSTSGGAREIAVAIEPHDDPLMERAFAIMRERIELRCPLKVVKTDEKPRIILSVDKSLASDAFRIETVGSATRISGGSPRGATYGVGKFLRTSRYDGGFSPSQWRGTSTPRGSLRGMYFATHFHNWHHQASEEEISRYMEDLALWGVNSVMAIFPMINLQDWDDPQSDPAMEMLKKYAKSAKSLGLSFASSVNNTMFIGAPKEIRATPLPDPLHRRGNSGHPICPSNPAGHEYLMKNARMFYERLSDVGMDILVLWPYDEGGCACEQCKPWGCNGYFKLSRDFANLGRSYFPNMKTVMSTWMFDTPPEGEWKGLTDALAKENGWLDYVLADAHEDYPRYPLDVGVPGKLPLLNFPEISMWGNSPWGGVGANPLPSRFQRLWDQVKSVVQGGYPYSEGIYEDMNKAVVSQFYWNPDQTARETLKEYAAYEFGANNSEDVLALVDLLEDAASKAYKKEKKNIDPNGVARAYQLAENLDSRLPDWGRAAWRWEILRLRATLDRERFIGAGLETPTAEAAMLRLVDIYHCQLQTDDPYHHRVRPPLRQATSRKGEC